MVKSNALRDINTRRTLNYISKCMNQVTQSHLFELKDEVTEISIRNMMRPVVDRIPGCKILPKRCDQRDSMGDVEKIIDIIEEEIDFDGKNDGFYLDIEFTVQNPIEKIQLNFTIK